jgi:hypothetical protein
VDQWRLVGDACLRLDEDVEGDSEGDDMDLDKRPRTGVPKGLSPIGTSR